MRSIPAARPSSRAWLTAAMEGGEEHSAAVLMGVVGRGCEASPHLAEEARDRREGVAIMSLEGTLAYAGASCCAALCCAARGSGSVDPTPCADGSSTALGKTLEPKGAWARRGFSSGIGPGEWAKGVAAAGTELSSSCMEACGGGCAGALWVCDCSRMLGQASRGGLLHSRAATSACCPLQLIVSISVPSVDPIR